MSRHLGRYAAAARDGASRTAAATSAGLPSTGPGSLLHHPAGVVADARVADTSPSTLAAIRATGATILAVDDGFETVSVAGTPVQLGAIADLPVVRWVQEEQAPIAGASSSAAAASAGASSAGASSSAGAPAAICPSGVVSEGDSVLNAASARSTYSINGAGVTVGVLSDSFDAKGGWAADVGNAELPGFGNPCGFGSIVNVLHETPDPATGADEGRAMSQIVHDLAPGSPITFASVAIEGQVAMAQRIRDVYAAGARVIVDDVLYPSEPWFQGGPITSAIEEVTGKGASYFSAGGNSNISVAGVPKGSYETAAYHPMGCTTIVANGTSDCLNFGSFANAHLTLDPGGEVLLAVGWNEQVNKVQSDFDIYLVDDSTGEPVAWGAEPNVISGRPIDGLYYMNDAWVSRTFSIVIGRYQTSAVPRLKVAVETSSGVTYIGWPSQFATAIGPTVLGHSGAPVVETVGAVPASLPTVLESFSSWGPAATCWYSTDSPNQTNQPLPACQSSTVDFVATDGTVNTVLGNPTGFGTYRFFGTSAAAPHAAAVAALLRQRAPNCTAAQVSAAMHAGTTAINGVFPVDARGAGRVNATAAVASLGLCSPATHLSVATVPTAVVGTPTSVRVTARNASEQRVPGENGLVHLTATPGGAFAATDLTLVEGEGVITLTPLVAGSFTVTATLAADGAVNGVSGSITASAAAFFHPVTPTRILDSRAGPEQVGPYSAPWGPKVTREVQVTGGAVPSNAAAVVLNVTVTSTTAPSFLSIWPSGEGFRLVSSLNWSTGQTIPNAVTAKVGENGKIQIFNNSGYADVIVDLVGYYDGIAGDGFTPVAPSRLVDSRLGLGGVSQWTPGSTQTVQITGATVPAGATALVANVTVTATSAYSFLTIWPGNLSRPLVSSLNWSPGQTIANAVTVPLSPTGAISIYSPSGNVDVIIDVVGWFASGSGAGFHPVAPIRSLDSRPGGPPVGAFTTPWGQGTTRVVDLTSPSMPSSASAVLGNVTVTSTSAASFLTIYPGGTPQPNPLSSNLNWLGSVTIANAFTSQLGAGGSAGKVNIFNPTGSVDVIIDVAGWYG